MAKARPQPSVAPYRVRIPDSTIHMLAPGEIADHPLQHKAHPPQQREAMAALCREIGIAGVLLVYRSPGNAGQLTAIDGHLRKSLDPHQPWPCVLLDVDDDEAAYLLLTHDEIGRLAELLRAQTATLMQLVQSGEHAVRQLLTDLAVRESVIPVLPQTAAANDPAAEWGGMPEFAQEDQLGWKQLIVHFEGPEALQAFARLVEQSITEQTRWIWYPYKPRRDLKALAFVDEP